MQNLKKLFLFCIAVGILCISCKQVNDTQKKEQDIAVYVGSYEGIFSGSFSGEWGAIVDETGLFTGEFKDTTTNILLSAKGTVDGYGVLSGVMTSAGGWKVDFSGNISNTKKVSGNWMSDYGKGPFNGVKVTGASLTINNQSRTLLEEITYGGKVYSKLSPGNSCKIEFKGDSQGYIFFVISKQKYRTKDVIIIKKGEAQSFVFTDNTLREKL